MREKERDRERQRQRQRETDRQTERRGHACKINAYQFRITSKSPCLVHT